MSEKFELKPGKPIKMQNLTRQIHEQIGSTAMNQSAALMLHVASTSEPN